MTDMNHSGQSASKVASGSPAWTAFSRTNRV